ncbi:disease resistance protein (TIR-NBS-LRR class) [Medicago truncatula]|uniref:Disease resistance protein (TIR-NBS-LRR class) n=1 Tax=Medicago truncatula TaxID=3880 RepID=G7L5T1_MEDTR|nr:disease resistance protein (TIR-NBS-LRR class) [Medicago truncatula]
MASSSSTSSTNLFVADHPVGVESRVQEVIQLLKSRQSEDPVLLGIWGGGGIGKTTIAKAVYNEIHRHHFEARSFLLNVGEVWKQDNGEVSLQKQLISVIRSSSRRITINTVESGKRILQERLPRWKILLVVDDVNKKDQLGALCIRRKWFGQGSIIIITTRDHDLLRWLQVDHVYTVNAMNDSESLEATTQALIIYFLFLQERFYDVFLSFRGKDTRERLTSHLYTSLQNAGIYVFRDDNEIQPGEKISVYLLEAIRQYRICIVVLYSNYASSNWRMQELEEIMKCRRRWGLVVIPVFYEVDPSEVEHQTGWFGDGFERLISRISMRNDMRRNWKEMLLEIGGIAGFIFPNSRNGNEYIRILVEHVKSRLSQSGPFY